jgi:hypothetical protein
MTNLVEAARAAVGPAADRLHAEAAASLLGQVGEVIEDYAFGSDWRLLDRVLSPIKSELLPIAQALARNSETGWWDSSVALGVQRLTAGAERNAEGMINPTLSQRALAESYFLDAQQGWWSIPPGLSTTRGDLPEIPSVALLCREGYVPYREQWSVWTVEVPETARVYEVSSLDDWVNLTEMHKALHPSKWRQSWSDWTGYSGEWATPDWSEVAKSWDGVHISLLSYLSAAYRKVKINGSSAYLAGWSPDETVWFSDVRIGKFIGSYRGL